MDYSLPDEVRVETDGPVRIVRLARPAQLNAINADLHLGLTRVFPMLSADPDARVAVITGEGRAFSAGGDFAWFPKLREPGRMEALRRDAKQLIWDLLDVEIPIVAAVNGHAMGLGASIALACDVILMADTATVGDPHVRVGIVAGDGGTAIWPLAVGPARAKEYLLTGDRAFLASTLRVRLRRAGRPHASTLDSRDNSVLFSEAWQRCADG
jgi:enoyl-CoA hydratase